MVGENRTTTKQQKQWRRKESRKKEEKGKKEKKKGKNIGNSHPRNNIKDISSLESALQRSTGC